MDKVIIKRERGRYMCAKCNCKIHMNEERMKKTAKIRMRKCLVKSIQIVIRTVERTKK